MAASNQDDLRISGFPQATHKEGRTEPPKNSPSADATKSATDGCPSGEKCCRYSKTPAYIQDKPLNRIEPRLHYPEIAVLDDPA